jgi:hypothetical protein
MELKRISCVYMCDFEVALSICNACEMNRSLTRMGDMAEQRQKVIRYNSTPIRYKMSESQKIPFRYQFCDH